RDVTRPFLRCNVEVVFLECGTVQCSLNIPEHPCSHIVTSGRQSVNPRRIHLRNHTVKIARCSILGLHTKLKMKWNRSTSLNEPVLRRAPPLWVLSQEPVR